MSLPESTAVILIRRFSNDTTLEDAAKKLTKFTRLLKQYIAAIVVNLLSFSFGTVIGWPAPAQPQLQAETTPIGTSALSDDTISWLAAVMCFGTMGGTLFFGWLSEKLGRKVSGLLAAIPCLAGWLTIILADHIAWLFVARVLAGLGGGGSLVVCPLYVGEIAEDSVRGSLGCLFSVSSTAGILFAFIVGSLVSFRTYAIICLVIPGFFFGLFLGLPDSPVYLLSKGRVISAVESIRWLRGGDEAFADDEISRMVADLKRDSSERNSGALRDLIFTRAGRRGLTIVLALFTMQQCCGVIAIINFTVDIFEDAGSSVAPTTATMIIGGLQLLGVCVSSVVVDRAGRRILLIASCLGMSVCLLVLGGCFYAKDSGLPLDSVGWLPVTALSIFIVVYALGLGPLPFVILSEVCPPKTRGLATSISITWASVLAFLVTKFFTNLSEALGAYGAMWGFAVCCVIGALFTWFFIPETRGRSLEDVIRELSGRQMATAPMRPSSMAIFSPPSEYSYMSTGTDDDQVEVPL